MSFVSEAWRVFWKPRFDVRHCLLSIEAYLANPNPQKAVSFTRGEKTIDLKGRRIVPALVSGLEGALSNASDHARANCWLGSDDVSEQEQHNQQGADRNNPHDDVDAADASQSFLPLPIFFDLFR